MEMLAILPWVPDSHGSVQVQPIRELSQDRVLWVWAARLVKTCRAWAWAKVSKTQTSLRMTVGPGLWDLWAVTQRLQVNSLLAL